MKRTDLYLIVVSDSAGNDSHAVIRAIPELDYAAGQAIAHDWVNSDGNRERVVSHRGARLPPSELVASLRTSVEHDPSLKWVKPLLTNGDKRLVQGDHPFR